MQLFLLVSLFFAAVQAANIRNWSGRDCKGNYRVCTNIPQNRCCYHAGAVYAASSFHYIADTSFGLVCTGTANQPCQMVRAARHAGGCVQPVGSTTRLRGSYWFDCHNRVCPRNLLAGDAKVNAVLEVAAKTTDQVETDAVVIDNHPFYVNHTVPDAYKDRLHKLVDSGTTYEQVPKDLKKYEIYGEAANAILLH
jgi:hypothetical protein